MSAPEREQVAKVFQGIRQKANCTSGGAPHECDYDHADSVLALLSQRGEAVAWAPYLEDEEFTKPEDGILFDGTTGHMVAFYDKERAEAHHGGKYKVLALYAHPPAQPRKADAK